MSSTPTTLEPPAGGPDQEEAARPGSSSGQKAAKKALRGSSLLLLGRLISVAANFATQVLIVRHLSKADFGIFAYALSIVAMGQSVAALGIDRAVSRFVPMYDERREDGKLLGTLAVATATIVLLGLACVCLVAGLGELLAPSGADGSSTAGATVLLIMIVLAPLQALDTILVATFAAFSRSRSIFIRKHLLTPGLRLAAVVAVVAAGSGLRHRRRDRPVPVVPAAAEHPALHRDLHARAGERHRRVDARAGALRLRPAAAGDGRAVRAHEHVERDHARALRQHGGGRRLPGGAAGRAPQPPDHVDVPAAVHAGGRAPVRP
jgi:hypothetical protein